MMSDKLLSAQWCESQQTSCPLICLQLPGASGVPEDNNCDPVSAISDIYLAERLHGIVFSRNCFSHRDLSATNVSAAMAQHPMRPNTPRQSRTFFVPCPIRIALTIAAGLRLARLPVTRIIPAEPRTPRESTHHPPHRPPVQQGVQPDLVPAPAPTPYTKDLDHRRLVPRRAWPQPEQWRSSLASCTALVWCLLACLPGSPLSYSRVSPYQVLRWSLRFFPLLICYFFCFSESFTWPDTILIHHIYRVIDGFWHAVGLIVALP